MLQLPWSLTLRYDARAILKALDTASYLPFDFACTSHKLCLFLVPDPLPAALPVFS